MGHKEMEEQIYQWCKQAQEKSGLLEDQKKYVWSRAKKDKALMTALAEYACSTFCNKMLYNRRNRDKANLIDFCASYDGKTFDPQKGYGHSVTKRTFEVMLAARQSIMDTYLCGNIPIGQADKAHLLKWAEIHQNRSVSDQVRAAIYVAVAAKVTGKKTVKECMNNDELSALIGNAANSFKQNVG